MAHKPHAFENQIFQHFRDNANKINNCINFLVQHHYTVIDLEGSIITKQSINQKKRPNVNYDRAPKLKQH